MKKKRLLIIVTTLTVIALTLLSSFTSFCEGAKGEFIDKTNRISLNTYERVENEINKAYEKYGYSVVIVIDYLLDEYDMYDLTEAYYKNNGYSQKGGIILYVGINSRTYCIYRTVGNKTTLIDEDELDYIDSSVYDCLHSNDFDSAVIEFASLSNEFMDKGAAMTYVVGTKTLSNIIAIIIVCLVLAFVVSILIMLGIKSSMKNVRPQSSAVAYVDSSSFKLKNSKDRFLYSRVTRVVKPQNNTSGGGGGRSSGGSFRGGKF